MGETVPQFRDASSFTESRVNTCEPGPKHLKKVF